MAYWDCPKCAAENSLDANTCWRCGYQNYPGYQSAASSRERSPELRDSLQKQRQDIREELKKGLKGALERSRASLDRLAGELPGSTAGQNGLDSAERKKVSEPESPNSKDKPQDP